MSRYPSKVIAGHQSRKTSVMLGLCTLVFFTSAQAAEVIDPFFKATGFKENHVYTADAPDEAVDPHTGNVSIVHRDLTLPQKGQLKLSIVRRYDSKLYQGGKLIAAEEYSPVGLGWSLHMGRLHAPTSTVPVYEAPDGTRIHFYHSKNFGARKVSREHWMLDINCAVNAVCMWDNKGIRYDFYGTNAYYRAGKVGGSTIWPLARIVDPRGHLIKVAYRKGVTNALGVINYIIDSFNRKIIFDFDANNARYTRMRLSPNGNPAVAGAPASVVHTDLFSDNSNDGTGGDQYSYDSDKPGDLYKGSNIYKAPPTNGSDIYKTPPTNGTDQYQAPPSDGSDKYKVPTNPPTPTPPPSATPPPTNSTTPPAGNTTTTAWINYTFGYIRAAGKNLLTVARPPVGPPWRYSYIAGAGYSNNGGAIRTMTYPSGATITYIYKSQPFKVNPCNVQNFSVVTQRKIAGRSMAVGTWSYVYQSGPFGDRTVITRPDGKKDVYTFFGMGNIGAGKVWRLGLPISISRADGAEVVNYIHAPGAVVSQYQPTTPRYGVACAQYKDSNVVSVRRTQVTIHRDGQAYRTTYKNFDAYDQAQTIEEVGHLTRLRNRVYFYNPARRMLRGRLKWERVTQNGVTASSWAHNTFGELTVHNNAGVVTAYGRNNQGDIIRITDASQKKLYLSHYYMGVPRVLGFNGVYSNARSVDWLGRITASRNGRGFTTVFQYDAVGRPVKKLPPLGNAIFYAYDQTTGTWAKETRSGYWKIRVFDGVGREIRTLESTGKRSATNLNNMGWISFRAYPYANDYTINGDTFHYDGLGRPVRVVHSDASFRTTEYTKDYQLDTDERGYQTKTYYSAFGEPSDRLLTRFISVSNHETRYKYGPWGNLLHVDTHGTAQDRTYAYNAKGQLIWEKNPESGVVTYGRTPTGLIAWRKNARGHTAYVYDALHRLRKIDYPGTESDATFAYDNANNLIWYGNPRGGAVGYGHDKANRRTRVSYKGWGRTWASYYAYDNNDCVTKITYPSGRVVWQAVDGACRVTKIPGYINNVAYAPHGAVKKVTYANGRVTTNFFDGRRRVSRTLTGGVYDLHYGYDAANNIVRADQIFVTAQGTSRVNRRMKYDSRNRLTEATGRWGTLNYGYNVYGNRWGKKHNGKMTEHQYDAGARLTETTGHEVASYRYDAVGNMLKRDGFTHAWDAADRLRNSSTGAAYGYDGQNKRTWRRIGNKYMVYLYGLNGELLTERLSTNAQVRDYIYLHGKAIAVEGRFDL